MAFRRNAQRQVLLAAFGLGFCFLAPATQADPDSNRAQLIAQRLADDTGGHPEQYLSYARRLATTLGALDDSGKKQVFEKNPEVIEELQLASELDAVPLPGDHAAGDDPAGENPNGASSGEESPDDESKSPAEALLEWIKNFVDRLSP